MNSALYIGATGLTGLSQGMQVVTNNVANVNTIGFKKQDIQFSDLMYTTQANMGDWWLNQDESAVAQGQTGKGLQVESVRTIFQQGAMESTNTLTDLAINGRGFFQVSDESGVFYTRAGDFRTDSEGVLRNPEGYALNGYAIQTDGSKGPLQEVELDRFGTLAAKASSEITWRFNIGTDNDYYSSDTDPYFAMLSQYDATATPPLPTGASGSPTPLTLYGQDGTAIQANVYFDQATSSGAEKVIEFLVAIDPASLQTDDTTLGVGSGLLMSGTLTFDGSGQLKDMSAFVPSTAGSKDLADWVPATIADGLPQLDLGAGPATVDFGLSAKNGWQNPPDNAAAVGTQAQLLPSMGSDAARAADASTAYGTGITQYVNEQDGYPEGYLSNVTIGTDGIVTGSYSNNQSVDLWQIPVVRFHNQEGLRREGNNLYSAGPEVGEIAYGNADDENYGEIMSYNIELSNVDLASELVNMITTQRGFQSNSKIVTTADAMLQKAIELKRS